MAPAPGPKVPIARCTPTVLAASGLTAGPCQTAAMVDSFVARFAAVRARRGPLVWGLDPSAAVLRAWGLPDSADGLERFVDIVVPAAADTVGIVKPQSAFYERHGWRGVRALARLVTEARRAGLLVVMDAKRGDIGSTNDAYADAYLRPGGPLTADALTVAPYLGVAAMGSLVGHAADHGGYVLVVVRSSNPEGRALQGAVQADGRTVEAALLDEIAAHNAATAEGASGVDDAPRGPLGAVVAPAPERPPLDVRRARCLFLAPGVGAQGATLDDVAAAFAACPDRVMPSASRSILSGGPDPSRLRDVAATWADEARRILTPSG